MGFIGGKTQTDSSLGTMNDLFLDGEQQATMWFMAMLTRSPRYRG